jgi:penicillin-binding protein 2
MFVRRAFVFTSLKLVLGFIVLVRLSYLQIFNSVHYKLLSEKNRLVTKQILPARGNVLDSTGKYLAKNKFSYSVVFDLLETSTEERAEAINILLKEKKLDEMVTEKLKAFPKRVNRENRLILLQEDLNWETLARYSVLSSKIPGIVIEKFQTRSYLYPEEFSHVIGYIGSPTKEEVEKSENTAFSLPMAKTGKTCIEKYYDSDLFGKAGIRHVEVNSRRQFVKDIDTIDSTSGKDLNLTINLDLQLEVYKILSQHRSASCVVMDVHNGAILALVSYPGYDTNIFTKRIEGDVLKALYENPYKPMINKVVSGLYAPGSAFKMITGLAGLKKGVINKDTRFNCSGFCELGNHKFHCWMWRYGGHGSVNLKEALAQSCDVYFYNVAKLLSADDIAKVANDFGLGEITKIDIPNEKQGLIPTKSWKKEKKKQKWTMGDTFNMAIGQGFVLSTPIQLVKMISIFVNGLIPITPHLLISGDAPQYRKLDYKPEHIKIILDGMYDVVNSPKGTARKAAIFDEDFKFAGKTGSSQVFRITEQLRREGKTTFEDYQKKEHAIFVGFAPTDDPQIAVLVLVEHGGSGANTSAPIARDVLLAAKKYLLF